MQFIRKTYTLLAGSLLVGIMVLSGCSHPSASSSSATDASAGSKAMTQQRKAAIWKPGQTATTKVVRTTPKYKLVQRASKNTPLMRQMPVHPGRLTAYLGSPSKGIIGLYGGNQTDNPADNIFSVKLDVQPTSNDKVWLTYRLAGVAENSGVACSINDRLAFGGYLVKTDTATRRQRIQLNADWLQKGENRIQFGLPEKADYGYRVSDLALEVEQGSNDAPVAVSSSHRLYNGKAWVHGFVADSKTRVTLDGKELTVRNGEFETLITPTDQKQCELKASVRGAVFSKNLHWDEDIKADREYALNAGATSTEKTFAKNQLTVLKTPDVTLQADKGSVTATKLLSVTALRPIDLPALDLGMTNVTADKEGFRFLPHGQHFVQKAATVSLKYDRTKIPDGYTENDIRTFYFDNTTRHWVALDRDTVDKSLCMVVSKTTHFTDMINGVIKTPESPQTEGFAPTMMNDIKAADPTSKIEMIAPPSANNQGSANLSYPIELPPARNGMSPQLAITYNSDGGSGWLGEGWDLNIPSITVDTRWGVPRYDANFETETYSMGGTMLATVIAPTDSKDSLGTPSVGHRGVLYERRSDVMFHPVTEGSFSSIIRHGSSPDNYYWVVTDKSGVTYIYGANTASGNDNSYYKNSDILTGSVTGFEYIDKSNPSSGKHSVTKTVQTEWKLSEVIDLHGFTNKYNYDVVYDTINGSLTSKRLVLREIVVGQKAYNYSSSSDTVFYRVMFASRTKKVKQQNSGRYGFLASGQNTLLDSVNIYADTLRNTTNVNTTPQLVRSYAFKYKSGAFSTELLDQIKQVDNKQKDVGIHQINYYNTVIDNNAPDTYTESTKSYSDLNNLGSGHSNSWGWSAYLGVGVKFGGVQGELGYQHAYGSTISTKDVVLVDMNGDGLPDKVVRYTDSKNRPTYAFYPNNGLGSFGSGVVLTNTPQNMGYTEAKSYSDGWQGVVSAGISDKHNLGIEAGMDWTTSYSKTNSYLIDVNNDGLIDVVDNGKVYFNNISLVNGVNIPAFDTLSKYTRNPIKNIKTIVGKSNVLKCQDPITRTVTALTNEQLEIIKRTPVQDVVRFWEAPFDGTISVKGSVKLIPCTKTSDGVALKIQKNKEPDVLYDIQPNDSATLDNNYTVSMGDRIYFRLQCGTGILSDAESDVVLFRPVISYTTGVDNYTEYGYNSQVYKPSDAPIVNKYGYNLVDTISNAKVTLKGRFIKPTTSDWVKLSIYTSNDSIYLADSTVVTKSTTDTSEVKYRVKRKNLNYQAKREVWTRTYSASQNVDSIYNCSINAIAKSTTQYWFELSSNTNVRWDQVKWNPELHFTSHGRDTVIYAGVKYNMYSKRLTSGGWIQRSDYGQHSCDNEKFTAKCNISFAFSNSRKLNSKYTFHLISEKKGLIYGKTDYINNNNINIDQNFTYDFDYDYNNGIGDRIKAYLFIDDTISIKPQISYQLTLDQEKCSAFLQGSWKVDFGGLNNINIFTQRTNKELELGSVWRGWGQFEYNNTSVRRFSNPLVVDSLYIPTNEVEMDSLRNPYIYRIVPEATTKQSWQGVTRQIYIKGDTISTGRANVETLPDFSTLNSAASYVSVTRPSITTIDNSFFNVGSIGLSNYPAIFYKPSAGVSNKQLLFFGGKSLIRMDANKNPLPTIEPTASTTNTVIIEVEADSLFIFKNAPALSNTNKSWTYWGGASMSFGKVTPGLSGSHSNGSSTTTMAYQDMNGDGYPDFITDDQIEFTNSRGSRDGEKQSIHQETSESSNWSIGISGAYALSGSPTDKNATLAQMTASLYKNPSASVSLNGSHTENKDGGTNSYIDVNGDGLPDRIYQEIVNKKAVFKVCLNLGYGFSAPIDYGIEKYQEGKTYGNSIGASGSIDAGYIGGGRSINHSWSTSKVLFALRDMNGDGLNDKIYIGDGGTCYIAYNLGNRFTEAKANNKIEFINENVSDGTGNNLNFKVTIPIWLIKIVVGGGVNIGVSSDYVAKEIQDINGDGFPDLLSVNNSGGVNVRLSTIGKTNKLQSVTNPLGGTVSLDYARTPSTTDHPGGKWVMKSVVIDDGVADDGTSVKDSFEYAGGKYDRYEREFLGFGTVKTLNINTDVDQKTAYRSVWQSFDTNSYYTKGEMTGTDVYEGNGSTNRKYSSSGNSYYSYGVSRYIGETNPKKGQYGVRPVNLTQDNMVKHQYIVYAPLKYTKSEQLTYDNGTQSLITSEVYCNYNTGADTHGELINYKYSNTGGLGSAGTGSYTYRTETQYNNTFFRQPIKHTVKDKDGKIYRQVCAEWEPLFANHLTKVKNALAANDTAVTDLAYDRWGNLIRETLPANSNGQRMTYNYTYGDRYHQYLTQVTDALGYSSTLSDYNYKYGVACRHTDMNGNVMTTQLDNRGRLVSITGPNEQGTGKATIQFDYHPELKDASGNAQKPYAVTKHYDPANPTNNIETVTFVDGLGRAIQVKKDGYVNGAEVSLVSGRVKYDALGRAIESYYPGVETDASKKYVFNAVFNSPGLKTTNTYDVLDRVLSTTLPDKTTSTMAYSIADGCLKTTVTDALGNKQETYANGSGKTVKSVQYHNGKALTTYFHYDAIEQVDSVTDPVGKKTISVYDLAGRRTQVTHPATGTTKFGYDAAGDLLWKYTANKDTIKYGYDFGRLVSVTYPKHPENNVRFTFGDKNAGNNRVGRLVSQEDGSGAQEFWYGKQGELTKVRRTLIVPNQAVASYVTQWQYDSWNRLQKMTYPDGEELSYGYNVGGQLVSVKNKDNYSYVSNITYDKFGERTQMTYGNGAVTNYTYNDSTRNLQTLRVTGAGSQLFMNNVYKYDRVHNVKNITNQSVATENGIGGATTHSYGYDDLYRLTSAAGTFAGAGTKSGSYGMTMDYDDMYNPISKQLTLKQYGIQYNDSLNTGYNLSYTMAGNSQQIANIAETNYRTERMANKQETANTHQYSYDANGNLLAVFTGTKQGDKLLATNSRKMLWDEDNHLLAVSDNGFVSNYWYDAAGERTVKETGDGEGVNINGAVSAGRTGTSNFTVYVNPYTVINNGGQMSKHIYVGGERILSKLCDAGSMADPTKDTTACAKNYSAKYTDLTSRVKTRFDSLGVAYYGKDNAGVGYYKASTGTTTPSLYYFHSDHLGSASLITDGTGHLNQSLAYIPNGEVFVNQQLTSFDSRYKFSGKEMDAETGLYYFSQRYMDPKSPGFISSDPLRELKPWIGSYVYCSGNPMNKIDPDGMTDYGVNNSNGLTQLHPTLDAIKKFLHIKDDNDRIFKVNDDGSVDNNVKPCILPYGTVGEINNKTVQVNEDGKIVDKNGQYISVNDQKSSDKIYCFLRNNTDIEWSYLKDNNNKPNQISTSYDNGNEYLGINLLAEKLQTGSNNVILQHIHPILPNGLMNNEVSESDIAGAAYIDKYFPEKKVANKVINRVTYIVDDMQGQKFDIYNKDGVVRHIPKRKR